MVGMRYQTGIAQYISEYSKGNLTKVFLFKEPNSNAPKGTAIAVYPGDGAYIKYKLLVS